MLHLLIIQTITQDLLFFHILGTGNLPVSLSPDLDVYLQILAVSSLFVTQAQTQKIWGYTHINVVMVTCHDGV